jgi:hypothetical protein
MPLVSIDLTLQYFCCARSGPCGDRASCGSSLFAVLFINYINYARHSGSLRAVTQHSSSDWQVKPAITSGLEYPDTKF